VLKKQSLTVPAVSGNFMESIMENLTVKTTENGDVVVGYDYYNWTDHSTNHIEMRYTSIGRMVCRVFNNGQTQQVCEGLAVRGPTLMLSGSLEETIRKTLRDHRSAVPGT